MLRGKVHRTILRGRVVFDHALGFVPRAAAGEWLSPASSYASSSSTRTNSPRAWIESSALE